jgi:mono/diheme cytochrome c family protein
METAPVQKALRTTILTTLVMAAGLTAEAARGDEIGDAKRGLEYAQATCAGCHAILYEDTASPEPASPTFKAVADTPGVTRTALSVFLQSPHPTMPNLIVQGEDADNLIAYILSLKGDGSQSPR